MEHTKKTIGHGQLEKYWDDLEKQGKKEGKKVKLVAVTQHTLPNTTIQELVSIKWHDLHKELKKENECKDGTLSFLITSFLDFLKCRGLLLERVISEIALKQKYEALKNKCDKRGRIRSLKNFSAADSEFSELTNVLSKIKDYLYPDATEENHCLALNMRLDLEKCDFIHKDENEQLDLLSAFINSAYERVNKFHRDFSSPACVDSPEVS